MRRLHRWQGALRNLEQLLDGRLLDLERAENSLRQAEQYQMDVVQPGRHGLPPDGLRERLSRAIRLAQDQLQQLDERLSGLSIASSLRVYVPALQAGLTLGITSLTLLREAQLGGQELYRLTAGVCTLTFGSGQRMLSFCLSSLADARTTYEHLSQQVMAMHCCTDILEEPWACPIGPAIARTALKPSSARPWVEAAGAALRHALDRVDTKDGPPPDELISLAQLSLRAEQLNHVVMCLLDKHSSQTFGIQEVCFVDAVLCGLNIQLRLVEGLTAAAAGGNPVAARPSISGSTSGSSFARVDLAGGWTRLCSALYTACNGRSHWLGCLKVQQGGALQLLAPAAEALRLLLAAGPELLAAERASGCVSALLLASVLTTAWKDELSREDPVAAELPEVAALVMQMAPSIAAAVRVCIADSHTIDINTAFAASRFILELLRFARPETSVDQLVEWCHAADACLRLLPHLADLHAQWSSMPAAAEGEEAPEGISPPLEAAAWLVAGCIKVWVSHAEAAFRASLESTDLWAGDALAAASEPLWQLHSTVVRLVHWAAAMHSRYAEDNQLALLLPLPDWHFLADASATTLRLAGHAVQQALHVSASSGAPEEQQEALKRRLQAICAAHAQLSPVLAEKMGVRLSEADPESSMQICACFVLDWVIPSAPPLLVDPWLVAAFTQAVRHKWEASSSAPSELMRSISGILLQAKRSIPFAALLLTSGLMELGLELGVRSGMPDPELRARLFRPALAVCAYLETMSSEVLEGGILEAGSSGWKECIMPLPQLQECIDELPPSELLALFKLELFFPAAHLAYVLQDHWLQPEQQAALLLQAAQAASARSCANLRCPNLMCTGGPAAGPGKGCKRCSACRSVRYCSIECSRAGWGRGEWHRRACKALAAAWQGKQPAQGPA